MDAQGSNPVWSFTIFHNQDLVSFGRLERSKNSKLPLFSSGSSKSVNFNPSCQSLGKLIVLLASLLSGRYSGWILRGLIQQHMFIFRTVAFYSKVNDNYVYIYSTMSKSSLQGLLRQTVELLFSHPIIIKPWSQLVRLLLFNTTHTNSIPVSLCAF